MKKRLLTAGMAVIVASTLSGCVMFDAASFVTTGKEPSSSSTSKDNSDPTDIPTLKNEPRESVSLRSTVFVQELPDGGEVLCIYAVGSGGSISCDWESASLPSTVGTDK